MMKRFFETLTPEERGPFTSPHRVVVLNNHLNLSPEIDFAYEPDPSELHDPFTELGNAACELYDLASTMPHVRDELMPGIGLSTESSEGYHHLVATVGSLAIRYHAQDSAGEDGTRHVVLDLHEFTRNSYSTIDFGLDEDHDTCTTWEQGPHRLLFMQQRTSDGVVERAGAEVQADNTCFEESDHPLSLPETVSFAHICSGYINLLTELVRHKKQFKDLLANVAWLNRVPAKF